MRARLVGWIIAALAAGGVSAVAVSAAGAPDANLVAARAAAQRIMSLTPLPPEAMPQPADPSAGDMLGQSFHPRGADQVLRTQYWTVSQALGSVNAYIDGHPPTGSRLVFSQGSPGAAPGSSPWQEERSFPAQAGRVTSELLEIATAPATGGGTAVRADAIVLWRPTWDQIPASARTAHVRLDGTAQRAISGAALTGLRAFVNAADVVAPGVYACPAGIPGQAISVSFVDARGRALARIGSDSATGCQWLTASVAGRRGPSLLGGSTLPSRLWAAGSLTRCSARQLAVSVGAPSVGAQDSATIRLRNVERTPCSLKGAPTVELLTATGRRLPVAHSRMAGPASVVTATGRRALSSDLLWRASRRRCALPPPATALIAVPGIAPRFAVALTPSHHRLGPCSGRLEISALNEFG
jgi:hypothetical protein